VGSPTFFCADIPYNGHKGRKMAAKAHYSLICCLAQTGNGLHRGTDIFNRHLLLFC